MRSAAYVPLLAALSSSVHALPLAEPEYAHHALTGVPAPNQPAPTGGDYSAWTGPQQGTITGVPALETDTKYISIASDPTGGYITGVPAPDPTGGYLTGVPAPNPSQRPPNSGTWTGPQQGTITGVPAPEPTLIPAQSTTLPTGGWVTGVPAPDPSHGNITGVPALDGYSTWTGPHQGTITGVPAPDPSQRPPPISDTTWTGPQQGTITGVPAPNTSGGYTTGAPDPSPTGGDNTTSATPSPTQAVSCRPYWPTNEFTGTFRAAVIFVDFPDFPANTTVNELYDPIASAPAELFKTMSYGKLNLELVPLLDKFYRMPADSSSYGYARGLTTEAHLRYINDALNAVGPQHSFRDIDVLYVIPPKFADEISFSTSTGTDITALDGSVISSTITYGQDLFFSWGPKTVNHETGHAMGLPDLYPYGEGAVIQWVGGYDMMGLIGGQSPDYLAWHKWRLSWIEEEEVVCIVDSGKTKHRISPIEVADETRESPKAIAIPINGTSYVMAEVRSDMGVNAGACGTGVLLYTADSLVGSGDGPVKVIDTKPGSGGCDAARGGELNDAPLKVGEEYDTGLGVIVRVKSQEWNDFIVEVEKK